MQIQTDEALLDVSGGPIANPETGRPWTLRDVAVQAMQLARVPYPEATIYHQLSRKLLETNGTAEITLEEAVTIQGCIKMSQFPVCLKVPAVERLESAASTRQEG